MAAASVGSVPLNILLEARNHKVHVYLQNGEKFYGFLDKIDLPSTNLHLSAVHFNAKNGAIDEFEKTVIRGSEIKWILLPKILRNAPAIVGTLKRAMAKTSPHNQNNGKGRKATATQILGKKRKRGEGDLEAE